MIASLKLCRYKDLFGIPGAGLRTYRVFNIAIYDVVVTIIVSLIIWWILNMYYKFSFLPFLGAIFLLGIVAHRVFCVRTGVDKMLFAT